MTLRRAEGSGTTTGLRKTGGALRGALLVCGGAVLGAGTLVAILRWSEQPSRQAPSTQAAAGPQPTSGISASVLREAVRALGEQALLHDVDAAAPPVDEPSEAPAVHELTAEDYINRARAEPRDEAWARATGQTFEEDLQIKAQRLHFRVRSVECRSTACLAELNWASLRDARDDFKSLLGEPNRPNCHERLLLPQGDEHAAASGVLLLDCSRQRARLSAADARVEGPPVEARKP